MLLKVFWMSTFIKFSPAAGGQKVKVEYVSYPVPEYDPARGRVSRKSKPSRGESRSLVGWPSLSKLALFSVILVGSFIIWNKFVSFR